MSHWYIVVIIVMLIATGAALVYAGMQIDNANQQLQGLIVKYGPLITKVKSIV